MDKLIGTAEDIMPYLGYTSPASVTTARCKGMLRQEIIAGHGTYNLVYAMEALRRGESLFVKSKKRRK